jgi:hypothetical protein
MFQNKLSPERLRRYLIVAAMLIGCMVSYEADASRMMRGLEYGDIGFKRLVSVYRDAYKKAGFDVTTLVEKGGGQTIRLRMRFLPPGYSKKQKASMVLLIHSLESPSHTCSPCSVLTETSVADSDDLDNQMQRAAGKAKRQLDKILIDRIWYDPEVWVFAVYDHIGIDKVISSYKQAYAELGFRVENQVELKPEGEKERRIALMFELTDPGQSNYWGISGLYVSSSKSLGYESCAVTREPSFSTYSRPPANNLNTNDVKEKEKEAKDQTDWDANWHELSEKDYKAKEQAEANLAAYLRPRRDITKLRYR